MARGAGEGRLFVGGDIRSARQQATYKKLEIYARDWEQTAGAGDLHENGVTKINKVFRQIRRPFGFIFQYSTPMERQEVVLSDGDGFQSTQTLFERVMAVCYIQTVITVIKNSRKTDRLK